MLNELGDLEAPRPVPTVPAALPGGDVPPSGSPSGGPLYKVGLRLLAAIGERRVFGVTAFLFLAFLWLLILCLVLILSRWQP